MLLEDVAKGALIPPFQSGFDDFELLLNVVHDGSIEGGDGMPPVHHHVMETRMREPKLFRMKRFSFALIRPFLQKLDGPTV